MAYYADNTAKTAINEVSSARSNCFAYIKGRFFDSNYEECSILRKLYCRNEECKFFKTQEQFEIDEKEAQKRLDAMMIV